MTPIHKNCVNCKNFEYGGSDLCLKKNIEIQNPENYSCDLYQEAMFCYKCKFFDKETHKDFSFCKNHNIIVDEEDFCDGGEI
jgi:hypothetical protein